MDVEDVNYVKIREACELVLRKIEIDSGGSYIVNHEVHSRLESFDSSFLYRENAVNEESVFIHPPCNIIDEFNILGSKTREVNVLAKPVIEIVKSDSGEDRFLVDILGTLRVNNLSRLKAEAEKKWHDTRCSKCRFIREKCQDKSSLRDISRTCNNENYKHQRECALQSPDLIGHWGEMLQDLNRLKEMDPWEAIRERITELKEELLSRPVMR